MLNLRKLMKNHKAQEEMVGFAVIIVLVIVVLLIFLRFSITKSSVPGVENFEMENFLGAYLQYTTECKNSFERMTMEQLIVACNEGENCEDGKTSCDMMDTFTKEIIDKTWVSRMDTKGYKFTITASSGELLNLESTSSESRQGNYNYAGESLPGKDIKVTLLVYSATK
jgi:hypothetical protein